MPHIILELAGEGAWPDLACRDDFIATQEPIRVAVLPGGMASGKPSVAIRIDLPDGKVVVAETSAVLFISAARAIAAKFPGLGL